MTKSKVPTDPDGFREALGDHNVLKEFFTAEAMVNGSTREFMDTYAANYGKHNPGTADGLIGPKTKKAIKAFQKDQHLKVTGTLTAKTFDLLAEEAKKKQKLADLGGGSEVPPPPPPPPEFFAKHPDFDLDGHDLIHELDLAPWEAALGGEISVPTLEGKVKLKIAPGTQGGQKLRVRNRGLPLRDGTRGDLIVVTRITLPPKISAAEKELWEQLAEESKFQPRA